MIHIQQHALRYQLAVVGSGKHQRSRAEYFRAMRRRCRRICVSIRRRVR